MKSMQTSLGFSRANRRGLLAEPNEEPESCRVVSLGFHGFAKVPKPPVPTLGRFIRVFGRLCQI